ncbi:MAG TPA: hypothetical protein VJ649_10305 [Actinomycetes bacterium]|nr:hypothetical protein [Actinomycetes bacterium]
MRSSRASTTSTGFALLVLIGTAFLWKRRRSRTDHDVSDPGVTL